MSLHQLQVFDSVVRHGSLTKASEQTHCVPSALSRHLKAFQDEYGTLLHANGRGVEVTERGWAFYHELEPLLSQLATACDKYCVSTKSAQAKSLVIGGSRGASKSVLPSLITRFKKAHPTVEIELKAGASPDVQDLALKSEVDLALISEAVGVLYQDFLETAGSSGVFKILKVAELNLTVMSYIVYRKDKPLGQNARDFLMLLRAARSAGPVINQME